MNCSNHFEFTVFDVLHALAQPFTEGRPTPIDLAQAGIAAALALAVEIGSARDDIVMSDLRVVSRAS